MENSYQIVPMSEKKWIVRKTASKRASKVFETKKAAVVYGKKLMNKEKSKLFIHQKNGMVDDMFDYAYQ